MNRLREPEFSSWMEQFLTMGVDGKIKIKMEFFKLSD